MNPFEAERLLVHYAIQHSRWVAQHLYPNVKPEWFIFSPDGGFGDEHLWVWGNFFTSVETNRPLDTLISEISQYNLHTADVPPEEFLYELAATVENSYKLMRFITQDSKEQHLRSDPERFCEFAGKVKAENYVTTKVAIYRGILETDYTQISDTDVVVTRLADMYERAYNGEQLVVLDCGLQMLTDRFLFPIDSFGIIHGQSNGGKSAFAHQVNLGTAISLYAHDIPGCVVVGSLEMTETDVLERMASILAHVNPQKYWDGSITKDEHERMLWWMEFIKKLPIKFITGLMDTATFEYMVMDAHQSEDGPVLQVSADYDELFADVGDTEELRLSRIARTMFGLRMKTGASVLLISQSTDQSNRGWSGINGLRYSRAKTQAADYVIEIINPIEAARAGLKVSLPNDLSDAFAYAWVQKTRRGGHKGPIAMGWTREHTSFWDVDMNYGATPTHEIIYTNLDKALQKAGLIAPALVSNGSVF